MSLLEDVFLQDEANEAQELERVIEGDEFNDRLGSRSDSEDNSEREGEAEEEKRRIDPTSNKTKHAVRNPRVILNPARLIGPRGIQVIPEHFKDFKFRGKGHEKEDLDLVLKKLEHWAYRLYPKFKFEDCLKKIETLGKKRPVMVHLQKIRTDQFMSEETVVQKDSSDDEAPTEETPQEDEFDKLLQQQIELARSTPAPSSAKKSLDSTANERSLMMPKATSSPSISDEQKERMLRSRKLAEEKRLARLKNSSNTIINVSQKDLNTTDTPMPVNIVHDNEKELDNSQVMINSNTENVIEIEADNGIGDKRKRDRSTVIDSSDDEDDVIMNDPITVDVHKNFSNNDHVNVLDENGRRENVDNLLVNERNGEKILVTANDNNDIEHCDLDDIETNNLNELERNKNIHSSNLENNKKSLNDEKENNDDLKSAVVEYNRSDEQSASSTITESCNNKNVQKIDITEVKGGNSTNPNDLGELMDVDFSDNF